ncbi:MAG: putative baseplate assembly protein [Candidatus Solibacter sp.]
MSEMICTQDTRREQVRVQNALYGLDYLEIATDPKILTVYFLGRAPELAARDLVVEGGARIRNLRVQAVRITRSHQPEFDDFMELELDRAGDFSTYTLRVIAHDATGHTIPRADFDPRYASIDFGFKIECAKEFDCKPDHTCVEPVPVPPEINYLAKDYASFRQVIYDRLALLMPDWRERHVPDLGVALVEVMAYAGDYLSYYQDAVATEAYLDTARLRISVRRHARLVDYVIHEGANARTWIALGVKGDKELDLADIYFITNAHEAIAPVGSVATEQQLIDFTGQLPPGAYQTFEPVAKGKAVFHEAHNQIDFYTWGESGCCLPAGTTSATLVASGKGALQLAVGAVLIFEEVLGPITGNAADADPGHRHAVRLTCVTPSQDPLTHTALLEVEWREEDALPFPLCLSALLPAPECRVLGGISVARGNVILVDHGAGVEEDLLPVPVSSTSQECGCNLIPGDIALVPGRFEPRLKWRPLTFALPYDATAPATLSLQGNPRDARPALALGAIPGGPDGSGPLFTYEDLTNPEPVLSRLKADAPDAATAILLSMLSPATRQLLRQYHPPAPPPAPLMAALAADLKALLKPWSPAADLLHAADTDPLFVAEMDNDGYAHIRFGNGDLGAAPIPGAVFHARYRTGNGPAGNVGADSLTTLITRTISLSGAIRSVRNPLAAAGGTPPQALSEIKLLAPHEFRTDLRRAITAEDYAAIALRDFSKQLQNAAATLRWTGFAYEALVVIDPKGREAPDQKLIDAVALDLERYRRIGHEVIVKPAQRVPLEIRLDLCVAPHFRPDAVRRAVLELFSHCLMSNGKPGFFHPDNLTFGQGIYLSRVIALAQSAAGVRSVNVKTFRRYQQPATSGLDSGVLKLGALEIAQADNDSNYPEHGLVDVHVEGIV